MYQTAIRNTCGLMIIAPLIVVYLVGQRFLIQGIERSGVTG
jgi:ABC-type glycerol-3-phosphate transport system permease component